MSGLGGVAHLQEGLGRMLAAGDVPSGPEAGVDAPIGLHAADPIAFGLGVVVALDGEAQTGLAPGVGQVGSEQDDMRTLHGVHTESRFRSFSRYHLRSGNPNSNPSNAPWQTACDSAMPCPSDGARVR
jgi:hypothetical protein